MLLTESEKVSIRASAAFQSFVKDVKNANVAGCYLIAASDKQTQEKCLEMLCGALYCINANACFDCPECKKILSGHRSDIYRFPQVGKDKILTEDIEFILEIAQNRPLVKGYQLFILKNADEILDQAQNKLLKTLEEPPEDSVFFLGSTKKQKLLKTVLSRVKTLDFTQIDLSSPLFVEQTLDLFQNLNTSKDALRFLQSELFKKENFAAFLKTAEIFLHDMICVKTGKHDKITLTQIASSLPLVANLYTLDAIANIEDAILNAYRKSTYNAISTNIADSLLLRITEVKFLCR